MEHQRGDWKWRTRDIPFTAETEGDLFHILLLVVVAGAGRWGRHDGDGWQSRVRLGQGWRVLDLV